MKNNSKTTTLTNNYNFLKGKYSFLLIAVIGFLIYFPSLFFDYTYLDDHELILQRFDKLESISAIPKAFNEDAFHSYGKGFYYRPLLTISFVVDTFLGNRSFVFFHLSNIIFHIISALLFFLLLINLKYDRIKSFFFAVVFTVHPVLTAAVVWIPGRNDSLLAIFVLASFISFMALC